MIDFDIGFLLALSKPAQDVVGIIVREQIFYMSDPTASQGSIAEAGWASLVATISQNAAVFGGGAFGLKPEMSSVSRKAATCLLPPFWYQAMSVVQYS